MAIQGILRPGHAAIRVLDMDAAVNHYVEWVGLIETQRDDQGRVYLKGWDEHDLFSIVLREADSPGLDYMGFKVDSAETLEHYAKKLADAGIIRMCNCFCYIFIFSWITCCI